jgi:hypothetical protein
MEESRFYFMFSFDYYSSPFRKNPLGVIEAFPRHQIYRSIRALSEVEATIREAMDHDPRILLVDRNLPREEMLGLIRTSDAYVSLHRSEGFVRAFLETDDPAVLRNKSFPQIPHPDPERLILLLCSEKIQSLLPAELTRDIPVQRNVHERLLLKGQSAQYAMRLKTVLLRSPDVLLSLSFALFIFAVPAVALRSFSLMRQETDKRRLGRA